MIQFAWFWLFILLPLPWLVRRFLPPAPHQVQNALRVPFFERVIAANNTQQNTINKNNAILYILLWIIWILLISAAARPQLLGKAIELPVTGRDLLVAVDLSDSMKEKLPDGQTRLTVVKQVIGDFIAERKTDRIGLILFGKKVAVQTPLTFDNHIIKTMLNEAQIGFVGRSTAIGDAIGLAIKRLRKRNTKNRVLILITDGSNNAGNATPLQAAKWAAETGMRIYTIGFVIKQNNEKTLKDIAKITGGKYFKAQDHSTLKNIYQQLDELEQEIVESKIFRPKVELYIWLLSLAFFLSLIVLFIKVYKASQ
jgi:Ca-activated chloride channel family protein